MTFKDDHHANTRFSGTVKISIVLLFIAVVYFLFSGCSSSGGMDTGLIDRYENSVKAMESALKSGSLDDAKKAMTDFIPIANQLGKAMISVSAEQQTRIVQISDEGTQVANQVQAGILLKQFGDAVSQLEKYNQAGDAAGVAQHSPEAAQLADSLSLLETSMSPEETDTYTTLTGRFGSLSTVIAADGKLDDLDTALNDYRQAVKDQKAEFAQAHANNVKSLIAEINAMEGLSAAQKSRLQQLSSQPDVKKILAK